MTIEKPEHIAKLAAIKKGAAQHSGLYKLNSEIPESEVFLARLAERGENLGGAVSSLLRITISFSVSEEITETLLPVPRDLHPECAPTNVGYSFFPEGPVGLSFDVGTEGILVCRNYK